jgi:hypothetical protein
MKTLEAYEIKVPENLAELLDKRAGRKEGELRNLLAESGKLRDAKRETLKIAMGFEIKNLMESDELPEKPMSLKRFSQVLWTVFLTYVVGTIRIDDKGVLVLGEISDVSVVANLIESDKFVFRNGMQVDTPELMAKLQFMTKEDGLKGIYHDIAPKKVFKKKELDTKHALDLAELVMRTADKLQSTEYWG